MKTNTIFYKKRATILACATLAIPRFATESIAQTTIFVSLLVWFLVVTTRNYYWQYLWFLLPIIAGTGTYLSTRNQQPGIKTHLDKVINYIWLVLDVK